MRHGVARAFVILLVAVATFGCGVSGRNGGVAGQGICPTHPHSVRRQMLRRDLHRHHARPAQLRRLRRRLPVATVCLGGSCGCPPNGDKCGLGQSCCGADGCASLMTDIRNCGNCGTRCPDGATCAGGMCMCSGQACAPTVDPVGTGMVPPGMCTCGDSCANDPTHSCIAMDCCYADYVAGTCAPTTSCGTWTYQ